MAPSFPNHGQDGRLRVISWNLLRRVGAGVEDVAKLVKSHHPDLLLLQECTEDIISLPSLVGGHFFRHPMQARIYGLAAFHRASGEAAALDLARGLWSAVEAHARDPVGGYHEAFGRDWARRANELAGRDDAPKTFNAHFHLAEALAELYAVWPDPELGERLAALIGLILDRTFDGAALTFRQFGALPTDIIVKGLISGSSVMAGTYLARLIVERLSVAAFQHMLDVVMVISGLALLWQASR